MESIKLSAIFPEQFLTLTFIRNISLSFPPKLQISLHCVLSPPTGRSVCLPTERKSNTCALAYAVFSLSFLSQEYWSFCFLCSLLQHKGFHFIASCGFYFKSSTEITLFNIAYNFSVVKSHAHALHLTKILSSFSLSSFLLISFQTLFCVVFLGGRGAGERGAGSLLLFSYLTGISFPVSFASSPSNQPLYVDIIYGLHAFLFYSLLSDLFPWN